MRCAGWTPHYEWAPAFYAVGNADLDSDNDRLSDARELLIHSTDPDSADTDGDDFGDGEEVLGRFHHDPLNKKKGTF